MPQELSEQEYKEAQRRTQEALDKFKLKVEEAIENLFQDAKRSDEFGYAFSLLGHEGGMEDAGWNTFVETASLTNDMIELLGSNLPVYTKMRLGLLTYCHIFESNLFYHVIMNMIHTIKGEGVHMFSFLEQRKRPKIPASPKAKLTHLEELLTPLGHQAVSQFFFEVYEDKIRNSFFHSDYVLYEDEYRIKHGLPEKIPLDDVWGRILKTITIFNTLTDKIIEHRLGYKENKTITDRKNKNGMKLSDVELHGDPDHGITGFSSSSPLPLF